MSLKSTMQQLVRNPRSAIPFARSLRSTFSQYGEDQIFRLLMQPGSDGVYVDVGSHHPVEGSNTYNLYCRGWRGLTVDPNPVFEEDYKRHRGQETHLIEGVWSGAANLTYFEFADSRFSTLSDERARWLESVGHKVISQRTIACRPLRSMVLEYLAGRQIDLLSVDCEGLDQEVLESLDLAVQRPTVVLIEDYARFSMFRDGEGQSKIHEFIMANGYRPIAQLAFSALYVAMDWRRLFTLSKAYDARRIQGGILPESPGS
jgi:FkbM family methyltransferase